MSVLLKSSIRKEKIAARNALTDSVRTELSAQIVTRLKSYLTGGRIAFYHPLKSEADVFPLMKSYGICLPAVVSGSRILEFRKYATGQELEESSYGTMQPGMDAEVVLPDIVVVPLVAFDRRGFRVGYGGGFYDATLETLRTKQNITAIGIAFSMQEVPQVPAEAHDSKLDMVITEKEIIACT